MVLVTVDTSNGFMRRYTCTKNVVLPSGEAQFEVWDATIRAKEKACYDCIQNFRRFGLSNDHKIVAEEVAK